MPFLCHGLFTGSQQPNGNLVWQIHGLLAVVGVSLYKAMWIHGSLNVKVDQALRWVNPDNWELEDKALATICVELGCWEVGCFADHLNAKATCFL